MYISLSLYIYIYKHTYIHNIYSASGAASAAVPDSAAPTSSY